MGVDRVFLATTALEEFWETRDEILFLGTWCRLNARRTAWEGLRARVLPCPWNDRARYYRTIAEAEDVYEQLLVGLGRYLNDIHGVAYSTRAWRVLVGPWLWHFVHVVFDRYAHLSEALAAEPDLTTAVLEPRAVRVSLDAHDFVESVAGDAYNLQLFSDLLRFLGYQFPSRVPRDVVTEPPGEPAAPRRRLPALARRTGARVLAALNRPRDWAALCDMYMPASAAWSIALRSGFRCLPFELSGTPLPAVPAPHPGPMRTDLSQLTTTGEIGRAIVALLPDHLPSLYLEGFREARASVADQERELPAATVSSIGWLFNEPFKFLAADAAARGHVLITAQHGGNYGISRYMAVERHERSVADRFLVWGWATPETPDCRNVANPKISRLRRTRATTTPGTDVVFVATAHQRYLYRFHSQPVGSQFSDYLEWQHRFFRALPASRHAAVVFRPNAGDYGHDVVPRLRAGFPAVRVDRQSPFHDQLRAARLVVIDHCATTCLESLAANAPTILFWDPRVWELRPEAEPFFDMLTDAGILWRSPEEAARHAEAVYPDPLGWWRSTSVQDARTRFVARYALGSPDWADQWATAVRDEIDRRN